MTRRPKLAETEVPPAVVRQLAERVQKSRTLYDSQEELAAWLGVKQSTVSRLLGTLAADPKKRQTWKPSADLVALVAAKYGWRYDKLVAGIVRAGEREGTDVLPNRGRAMDFLSDEYSPALLEALKRHPAPADSTTWTPVKWAEYLVSVKKAWDSGLIELPGLARG